MPTPVLDQIEKNGTTYNLQDTQAREDIAVIQPALAQKANIDGYYENMSVGNAEQLISDVIQTDQVPYVFRTAGGSLEIGDRMADEMVGGSLNWNQLIQNGDFASITKWNTYHAGYTVSNGEATVTKTESDGSLYQDIYFPTDHVVFCSVFGKVVSGESGRFLLQREGGSNNVSFTFTNTEYEKAELIVTSSVKLRIQIRPVDAEGVCKFKMAVCHDLTALLGPILADYILALETATPGAGIVRLKSWGLFTKDYYPYKAVTMEHMRCSAHETVGFNAYDNATGKAVLLGGNLYQITGAYTALSYIDINGDAETITPDSDGYFTPAKTGTLTVTGGDATTTCVHLVWDETEDGNFAPYKKNTYPLDPIVLRGIPKKDADGNLYFDGDTYSSDGTVERRFVYFEFDGSQDESWGLQSINANGIANFYINSDVPFLTDNAWDVARCDKFSRQITSIAETTDEGFLLSSGAGGYTIYIRIKSTTAGTVTDFKTWLASNNVHIVVQRVESVTEEAAPFQNPQIVDNFGTERYVDYAYEEGERDFEFPAGHRTEYQLDCKAKIEAAPDSPDADGTYIMQRINGQNSYAPLIIDNELPDMPTTDGTYSLKVTVADGNATLAWASD